MTAPVPALPGLTIATMAATDGVLLENLSQLYVHDMSALFAGTARLDLGEDGRFTLDPPIDRWWREPRHVPLLLRWHGRPAGFALVNAHSVLDPPVDRAIAEFFIVRKYRRSGLGRAAAQAVFDAWPGHWEAAVMRANAGALTFWRRAVESHGSARDITVHDRDDARWNGSVVRFRIAPA